MRTEQYEGTVAPMQSTADCQAECSVSSPGRFVAVIPRLSPVDGGPTAEQGLPPCSEIAVVGAAPTCSEPNAGRPPMSLFMAFSRDHRVAIREPLWAHTQHLGCAGFPVFSLNVNDEAAQELEVYRRRSAFRARGRSETSEATLTGALDSSRPPLGTHSLAEGFTQPQVTLERYAASEGGGVAAEALRGGTVVARMGPVTTMDDVHDRVQASFGVATSNKVAAGFGIVYGDDTVGTSLCRRYLGAPAGAGRQVELVSGGAPPPCAFTMSAALAADGTSSDSDSDEFSAATSRFLPVPQNWEKARSATLQYEPRWLTYASPSSDVVCRRSDSPAQEEAARSNSVDFLTAFMQRFQL